MLGILFAVLAGAAMSIQGVMNTRLSEGVGLYESTALVQGSAFILSLLLWWWFGDGSLLKLPQTPVIYWFGGVLGMAITLFVIQGIGRSSPSVAISIILLSQLAVAALIDGLGWLGTEKQAFAWYNYAGFALMAGGVILLKLKPSA